jgi:hypothetical protein
MAIGDNVPFYEISSRIVAVASPFLTGKFPKVMGSKPLVTAARGFSRLSPGNQKALVNYGVIGASLGVAGALRIAAYKDPNVKAARAVRRSNSASKQVKGINAGLKVRAVGFRAGSLRSRSDRVSNQADSAGNKLGRQLGVKKPRGRARLRLPSVPFPASGAGPKAKAGFYAKTTVVPSTFRAIKYSAPKAGNYARIPLDNRAAPTVIARTTVTAARSRGKSDRLRYKANKATGRSNMAISARNQKAIAMAKNGASASGGSGAKATSRRNFRARRDGNGRFAGSY